MGEPGSPGPVLLPPPPLLGSASPLTADLRSHPTRQKRRGCRQPRAPAPPRGASAGGRPPDGRPRASERSGCPRCRPLPTKPQSGRPRAAQRQKQHPARDQKRRLHCGGSRERRGAAPHQTAAETSRAFGAAARSAGRTGRLRVRRMDGPPATCPGTRVPCGLRSESDLTLAARTSKRPSCGLLPLVGVWRSLQPCGRTEGRDTREGQSLEAGLNLSFSWASFSVPIFSAENVSNLLAQRNNTVHV